MGTPSCWGRPSTGPERSAGRRTARLSAETESTRRLGSAFAVRAVRPPSDWGVVPAWGRLKNRLHDTSRGATKWHWRPCAASQRIFSEGREPPHAKRAPRKPVTPSAPLRGHVMHFTPSPSFARAHPVSIALHAIRKTPHDLRKFRNADGGSTAPDQSAAARTGPPNLDSQDRAVTQLFVQLPHQRSHHRSRLGCHSR